MSFDTAEDLSFILGDSGVPVWYAGQQSAGVLDLVDAPQITDQNTFVTVRATSLLLQWGVLTGLKIGATITVSCTDYQIRELSREDDGAVVRLILAAL